MTEKIKIALTSGCPRGVGPEITASVAAKLGDQFDIKIYGSKFNQTLSDAECGKISFEALETATKDVMTGERDILVTAPINKAHWNAAGVKFIGHTEFLANISGTKEYAMMMASPKLKVTLATIHLPVKKIAENITRENIIRSIKITENTLKKYFGKPNPKIAVAALNPHCGDGGLLGDEEKTIIEPAIKEAGAYGPFPADTIFYQAAQGSYDAVIAMYHDQGLAAIKTLDFTNTVNVTLGLPFIRTSVDHGTAEDIAGQGIANVGNLVAAIQLGVGMLKHTLSS